MNDIQKLPVLGAKYLAFAIQTIGFAQGIKGTKEGTS